jgi:Flp pilus assembly protein TadG
MGLRPFGVVLSLHGTDGRLLRPIGTLSANVWQTVTRPTPVEQEPSVSNLPLRRDERGVSLSAFVATVVMALLLMGGLVIDGGAQSAAVRRCQQAAAQAARAASDTSALRRATGASVEESEMIGAARDVISGSGLQGEVSVAAGKVHVATHATTSTVFLSLIGITSLGAEGSAEASLETTP